MLLIASTGGHLAQLARYAPRLGASDESVWVTFASAQSESLLAGKRVLWVPYIRPRDVRAAAQAGKQILKLLLREKFEAAYSTGAALAVPGLALAKAFRVPTTYIESVSRVHGPSLSGRIVSALRLAKLKTQHTGWAHGRWTAVESVFSTYSVEARPQVNHPSLFVTLGTIKGYQFEALVSAVLESGLADERTIWQLGDTKPTRRLPGTSHSHLSAQRFREAALQADVTISHAGVGSLITLLELGVYPMLVVRRRSRNEHVDDHQAEIASHVRQLGVAFGGEVEDVDEKSIVSSTAFRVIPLT